jgi:NAD(P)-dependent dehydrogenase (short-subunit alcohol dehydrogenase family)
MINEISQKGGHVAGTLIVTGASRGIGAATALLAAERGYAVCINYAERADRAEGVVSAIRESGGAAIAARADVSDPDAVAALFDRATDELGPIVGLVNNAAITGPLTRLADVDLAVVRRVLDVNLLGAFICAREAVRRMATARGGTGGAIVNVSSRAAQYGGPGEYIHYAASKAAIEAMTMGLAREVAADGIRVNCVSLGFIDTEIHAALGDPTRLERSVAQIPMRRAGTPEEAAAAILWLLSDEATYSTGAILSVSGGR